MKFLIICLTFIGFQTIFAQTRYPYVQVFRYQEYLEDAGHGAILQHPSGTMFFGYSDGAIEFDGKNWWKIETGLPVQSFLFSEQFYVACDGDFGVLNKNTQGKYIYKSLLNKPAEKPNITSIHQTAEDIIFYSEEQIYLFNKKNKQVKSVSAVDKHFAGIYTIDNQIFINDIELGLLAYNGKDFDPAPQGDKLEGQNILFSKVLDIGKLLVGTHAGNVFICDKNSIKLLGSYGSAGSEVVLLDAVVFDTEIVLATNSQGCVIIDKNSGKIIRQLTSAFGLPENNIHAIGKDSENCIWMAHNNSFSRVYFQQPFTDFSRVSGLSGNITSLGQLNNQLYVGTDNGLYILENEIPKESELIKIQYSTVVKKKVFIPISVKKLQSNKNKSEKNKDSKDVKAAKDSKDVKDSKSAQNTSKEASESTEGTKKGLFSGLKEKIKAKKDKKKQEGGNAKVEDKPDTEILESVKGVQESPKPNTEPEKEKGNIVTTSKVVTNTGYQVSIKEGEAYTRRYIFKPIAGIPEKITDIKSVNNTLLVSSVKGFYVLKNNQIHFKITQSVRKVLVSTDNSTIYLVSHNNIQKLVADGDKWIKGGEFQVGQSINSIEELKPNVIVAGTGKGLFRIDWQGTQASAQKHLEQEGRVMVGKIEGKTYVFTHAKVYDLQANGPTEYTGFNPYIKNLQKHFSNNNESWWWAKDYLIKFNDKRCDTLRQAQLLDLAPDAIFADASGNIWVGSQRQLFKFQPDIFSYKSSNLKLKTLIREISITGKSYWGTEFKDSLFQSDALSLAYGNYNVKINFVTPDYNNPTQIQYFFKINDGEWTFLEEKDLMFYNLPAGNYVIKLKAVNANGIESEETQLTFYIAPPFYRTWWFEILLVLILGFGIYGYTQYRTKKIQEENRILEQKVEERTAEIREQKEIIEEKNKEILDGIVYSERIQRAMLPKKSDVESLLKDNHFVFYQPRDIVSGDFYWIGETTDGKILIAAGDCTGHGVPGALISMIGMNSLNQIVNQKQISEPKDVLEALHDSVRDGLRQGESDNKVLDGMDICIISIDKNKNQIGIASAQRPFFMIQSNKELQIIKGDKTPIGGKEAQKIFVQHTFDVKKGDLFYLFSDGYADQFNEGMNRKFQLGRFRDLLVEIQDLPMKAQKERLEKEFYAWKGNADQIDDVMVLGIRYI